MVSGGINATAAEEASLLGTALGIGKHNGFDWIHENSSLVKIQEAVAQEGDLSSGFNGSVSHTLCKIPRNV